MSGMSYTAGQEREERRHARTNSASAAKEAGWFKPSLNINVNASKTNTTNGNGGSTPTGRRGGGVSIESMLPEPDFSSPAAIRNYANHLRALAYSVGIELGMAAEILEATLREVPDPDGKPFGSRLRARRTARPLRKAADAATGIAKGAAGTDQVFRQQFQQEIEAVRHRARPPKQRRPQIDWAQQ